MSNIKFSVWNLVVLLDKIAEGFFVIDDVNRQCPPRRAAGNSIEVTYEI